MNSTVIQPFNFMPKISLTDFVDFVATSGSPKLTKVKTVKVRDDYNPAFDFWKRFREGVIDFHQTAKTNKKELDKIATGQTDRKKLTAYPPSIKGYKKFLGTKTVTWFDPAYKIWKASGLEVRVNPELGLEWNGDSHLIKMYMKADPLSKRKIDTILALMHDALSSGMPSAMNYCVLDVPRGKLYCINSANPTLLPLLAGEAASYITIWNNLP